MKRDGDPLWTIVTATVRPLSARAHPPALPDAARSATTAEARSPSSSSARGHPPPAQAADHRTRTPNPSRPPQAIEPNRFRRLTRGRVPIIDLHNLNQDRARAALTAFILGAHARGERTVLDITGKGARGDGVLRRRTPEWLAEPPLRAVIAGLSEAQRRHGGEGALYVALKRAGR